MRGKVTENNRPRHLDDTTAMFPAVPSPPKHARPDTGEIRRPLPPLPGMDRESPRWDKQMQQPDGVAPPPTEARRVTSGEMPRVNAREAETKLPWYKRWFGFTK